MRTAAARCQRPPSFLTWRVDQKMPLSGLRSAAHTYLSTAVTDGERHRGSSSQADAPLKSGFTQPRKAALKERNYKYAPIIAPQFLWSRHGAGDQQLNPGDESGRQPTATIPCFANQITCFADSNSLFACLGNPLRSPCRTASSCCEGRL
jgi:hypothetical protein